MKRASEAASVLPHNAESGRTGFRDHQNLPYVLLIGLAAGLAVILRWYGLNSQDLWTDEGATLLISRFSPRDIVRFLRTDTAPPLYYVVAHYWIKCFGTSVLSWRGLSAVCATLAIPLVYLISRKILADRTAEVLAMAACAGSFFQIWYAQEARSYSMLALFLLGAVYCLLLFLENRTPLSFSFLVLFITASLYMHNMAFFYLPGLALIWVLYPSPRSLPRRAADMVLAASAVLVLYAPWIPVLREQVHAIRAGYWVPRPGLRDPFDTLCILLGLDTASLQTAVPRRFHVFRLFGHETWLLAGLLVLGLSILGGLLAAQSDDRRKTLALAAYSIAPVFLVFLASRLGTSVYLNRVFIGSSVMLPILLAAPIAFQTGKLRRAFAAIALLVLAGIAVSAFGYPRHEQKEDWRSAANYLVSLPEKRRLVVGVPDGGQILIQYYAGGASGSRFPVDITGLYLKFELRDAVYKPIEINWNADPTALVASEISEGKYNEIDVAFQQTAIAFSDNPVVKYLEAHCGSVGTARFHKIDVARCLLRSTPPNE
ncbi:MAG: glycosyltransferase family 39 protein [Candidatus Acidiferrales bacterium]